MSFSHSLRRKSTEGSRFDLSAVAVRRSDQGFKLTIHFGSTAGGSICTWAHDIAPIIYKNCSTCHHTGGAGPFNLLTYGDAKRWAPQMVRVTQSRFMPPWLPEPGYGNFADVRRLSDAEIALIKRWSAEGLQQGELATAPEPPHYDSTWQLGKPDLILSMDRPYTLQANGTDVFRNLIFPNPLKQTRYVRAMEILPSTPRVVHHANVLIDRTASLRRKHPTIGRMECRAWN